MSKTSSAGSATLGYTSWAIITTERIRYLIFAFQFGTTGQTLNIAILYIEVVASYQIRLILPSVAQTHPKMLTVLKNVRSTKVLWAMPHCSLLLE